MESVESLCNQLARKRLLAADTIRTLRNRWRGEAGEGADNPRLFRDWLMRLGDVTALQLEFLDRGYGDFLYFGEYKLLERIGTGRMAGVYKAIHPLGQTVAIKVLPPSKSQQPRTMRRFRREARLAARLQHDNVVRTFQSGQHRDLHYLVMEYLDGQTLAKILEHRPRLPLEEALPILLQALDGLAHINEQGLVHRDIKPNNLMLLGQGGIDLTQTTLGATVKVLDIGLGRAVIDEAEAQATEDLTRAGTMLGTLVYMAPEQARDPHDVDIRADIYSLGCVAYEMLAGRVPYSGNSIVRQLRGRTDKPHKPLPTLVPGLAPAVAAIIDRMLAADPAQRYSAPEDVAKELRRVTSGPAAPVLAETPCIAPSSTKEHVQRGREDEKPTPAAEAASAERADKAPHKDDEPIVVESTSESADARSARVNIAQESEGFSWAELASAPTSPAISAADAPARIDKGRSLLEEFRATGWTRRDSISALLGAGVVLLFQLLIWLIVRMFG